MEYSRNFRTEIVIGAQTHPKEYTVSIQTYIADQNLEWQKLFSGPTDAFAYAYRGSLVVIPGKVISQDRTLPPKEIIKQVILATNSDTIDFLACEVTSIDTFESFFEKYASYLSAEGKYLVFICDITTKGKFVYNGITFYAYPLDESSVWNELLDFADLPKAELKKMSDKEKIDAIVKEVQKTTLKTTDKSLDEIKASKSGGKVFFGAV